MGGYDQVSSLVFVDGIPLIEHGPKHVGHGTDKRECTGGTGLRIRADTLNASVGGTLPAVILTCQGCGGLFEITDKVHPDPRSLIIPEV